MTEIYECIINPSSRSGKGKALWDSLKKRFDQQGMEYHTHMTEGPGSATRIARELTGAGRPAGDPPIKLVVLGGDGTLNEAVSGIQDFSSVLLGYLPTGSSNDFARGMKLPKNRDVLIERIAAGKAFRTVDVGRLTYNHQTRTFSRLHDETPKTVRHFLVSAGIGFDAAVCEEALSSGTKNILNRIGLGKLTYGAIAIRNLLSADRVEIDLTLDDQEKVHLDHFLFAAAMQLPYEGGGFQFAPDADPTDGKLNICLIGDMSKPKMLTSLPAAYIGKHYGIKGIYHYQVSRLDIRTALPMWVHTDGEVVMKSDDISIECLPGAMSLMI